MRKRSDPRPFPNCCCFCRSYGSTISGQLCCSCGVELGRGPGRLDPAAAGTAGCGRVSVAAATLRGFGLWLGMGWPAAFRAAGRDGGGAAWVHLPDRLYSGRGRGGTEKSRLRPLDRPGGAGVEAGPKPLPGILWRIAHELARTGWNVRAAIHVARTRRSQHAGDRPHEGTETLFLLARSRQYRTSPPGCSTSPRPDVWIVRPPENWRRSRAFSEQDPETLPGTGRHPIGRGRARSVRRHRHDARGLARIIRGGLDSGTRGAWRVA